jgi:tetratricopeptide (TPR) repeat protein
MASGLLNLAKQILRQAAEFGIEEAGSRLCGGTAWGVVKKLVSPVFTELERRYPKLFLVPEEMKKAERDLSEDAALEGLLHKELAALRDGQREILTVLVQYDDKLKMYRELIVRSFDEADARNESRHERVVAELANVRTEIAALRDHRGGAARHADLTVDELFNKANGFQWDAMRSIDDNDGEAARERLELARDLAMTGLGREPTNSRLMISMGYVEKSEAQVCMIEQDPEGATANLATAMDYFTAAAKLDPASLDAMNGMANVYYYGGDYDTAIELGLAIVKSDGTHGPALSDLTLSLEKKLERPDRDPRLVNVLVAVYGILEKLMPLQPRMFPASYLAHVQRRLAYWKNLGP